MKNDSKTQRARFLFPFPRGADVLKSSLREKFLKIIRENLPNPPLFWKSTKTRELRKIHSGNSKAMHNLNQPNNLNQQT